MHVTGMKTEVLQPVDDTGTSNLIGISWGEGGKILQKKCFKCIVLCAAMSQK